jgi:sulfopropanediol 3-dehydrogenase
MAINFLKKARKSPASDEADTRRIVEEMLTAIEAGGEARARAYGAEPYGWSGGIVVSQEEIQEAGRKVPAQLKDDLNFAHDRVRRFAKHQKASIAAFETELSPGL